MNIVPEKTPADERAGHAGGPLVPIEMLVQGGTEVLSAEVERMRGEQKKAKERWAQLRSERDEAVRRAKGLEAQLAQVEEVLVGSVELVDQRFRAQVHEDKLLSRIDAMELQLEYYMHLAGDQPHAPAGGDGEMSDADVAAAGVEELRAMVLKFGQRKHVLEMEAKQRVQRAIGEREVIHARYVRQGEMLMAARADAEGAALARKQQEEARRCPPPLHAATRCG